MRARGVNISIPEEWREAARSLDVLIGRGFARFDLCGGSAAYAIWVRLVARRRLVLTDSNLVADCDDHVSLVDDRRPRWRLGRQDSSGSRVLNLRIVNTVKSHILATWSHDPGNGPAHAGIR